MYFPSQVRLDAEEAWRASRARLALLLHKLPSEIDDAPAADIYDLIAIHNANQEAEQRALKK